MARKARKDRHVAKLIKIIQILQNTKTKANYVAAVIFSE